MFPVPPTIPSHATINGIVALGIPLTLSPCAFISPTPRNHMTATIAFKFLDVFGSREGLIVVNIADL